MGRVIFEIGGPNLRPEIAAQGEVLIFCGPERKTDVI